MNSPEDRPKSRLTAIRNTFLKGLPGRLEEMESAWSRLERGAWDPSAAETLYLEVHSIAGTAGTFGLRDLGDLALALDRKFKELIKTGDPPGDSLRSEFSERFRKLSSMAPDGEALDPVEAAPASQGQVPRSRDDIPRLLLLEDDAQLAEVLTTQLSQFGFEVDHVTTAGRLPELIRERTPSALLMDIILPDRPSGGIEALNRLRMLSIPLPPVIFMSARSDMEARLEGIRAGGDAYLTKPVNFHELLDTLDRLIPEDLSVPFRVAIVDDDRELADFYAETLRAAGMQTFTFTEPMGLSPKIEESSPDVILLDMHLPGCTGIELSGVIRQMGSLVHVPIVFVSAESDSDLQIAALRYGADDFMTKPVRPAHLVEAVRHRARRSRRLQSMMAYDGLTGLLNHSEIIRTLERDLARSRRIGSPLMLAMIDLDRFKRVNDDHGHLAGDQVLRRLSYFLRNRFRRTDVIGRYGGEEFAIILPEITPGEARTLLDKVRSGWSDIRHVLSGKRMSTTFSAGLASSEDHGNPRALIEAADQALYRAKSRGRNRVEVAGPRDRKETR